MTFEPFYLHRIQWELLVLMYKILFLNRYLSNILRIFHNKHTFDSGIRAHCNGNACIFVHYEVFDKKCVMYRVSHRYGNTLKLNFLTLKPYLKTKTCFKNLVLRSFRWHTLFKSENERQKIKPVPIPLPWASRNFPDVKTRNDFFFHNWTSEIISFICFGMQMDRT